MLQTIEKRQGAAFRQALTDALSASNPVAHERTLTTPGGPIPNAKLLWHPDPGLWSYISPTSYEGRRWLCWYGVDLGVEGRPLQPAVEINLATDPANKQLNGRALFDATSNAFFLGHKGSLGGGRGGQLKVVDFAHSIRGFAREMIQLGPEREEEIFVIGRLDVPDFRVRLKDYVSECARLRAVARAGRLSPKQEAAQSEKGAFTPECDQDGFRVKSAAEIRRIRRLHGRVVNALQERLGKKAQNSTRQTLRPDLYLLNADGGMGVLFEVKASADTQSWFTALGQLVVYGANEKAPPRRVLVCPAPLQDPAFGKALKLLGVHLVTFTEGPKGGISFNDLEPHLG